MLLGNESGCETVGKIFLQRQHNAVQLREIMKISKSEILNDHKVSTFENTSDSYEL